MSELADHLWQSAVFAAAVAILAFAFRRNRARVRYWLWFAASVKFLVPFAPLMAIGSRALHAMMPTGGAPPSVVFSVAEIGQPLVDSPVSVAAVDSVTANPDAFVAALLGAWAAGVMVVAWVRIRTWLRIRHTVARGTAMAISDIDIPADVTVKTVPSLMEPGVVGIWRQTLLLPRSIDEHLTRRQLRSVIAHELCHVRYKDNLTAAIHMVVEAIWWFHPVVWLIGSRLIDERERACDEAVLTTLRKPRVYAEAILNVCKFYVAAPPRTVAGVSSANLRTRVAGIIAGRTGSRLSLQRKIALAVATVAALTLPVMIGAARALAQVASAQPSQQNALSAVAPVAFGVSRPEALTVETSLATETLPVPETIRLLPTVATPTVAATGAAVAVSQPVPPVPAAPQSAAASEPSFEVASIRRKEIGIVGTRFEPGGRFRMEGPLVLLLAVAYQAAGPIVGGPAWLLSDHYSVEARAGADVPRSEMIKMVRSLVKERLKVAVHRESREEEAFALVLAKDGQLGPQLRKSSVDCAVRVAAIRDNQPVPELPPLPNGMPPCISRPRSGDLLSGGMTLSSLASYLRSEVGRRVVDKTGLDGYYEMSLRHREGTDTSPDLPSVVVALLEQLGLKLEPTRTTVEIVVVDRIELPTEN